MKTLPILLIILLLVPGCTFLKTMRLNDDPAATAVEETPIQPSSELVSFVTNNYEGAQSTISDSRIGTVNVLVGNRYYSASGYECIRAILDHGGNNSEILAICNMEHGWVLAPRVHAAE